MTDKKEIVLDDEMFEKVMKATGGAASPCFQCGSCTATCPWGLVREETVSVRRIIRSAQLGLKEATERLWLCTTCGACETMCPRGVPVSDVIRGLRHLAWKERAVPTGLPSLMWALYFDKNPFRLPPSEKANWASALNLKSFTPDDEILFYIGNMPSYDRRAQKISRALVNLFSAAKVRFGILGQDEPGCGEEALDVGHKAYLDEITKENAKIFQEKGVGTIVTVSPHCYDMFKNRYPKFSDKFKPLHYTQFLFELLESGRLNFDRKYPHKVVFQDPCYLGRKNEVYEAPREVLKRIPGLELLEMPRNRETGLCCGGGGGRMFLETAAGERFSDLRVKEAAKVGADVMATACPSCLACLEDSAKILGPGKLKVLDVAEIAVLAIPEIPRSKKTAKGKREKVKAT